MYGISLRYYDPKIILIILLGGENNSTIKNKERYSNLHYYYDSGISR